MTYLPMDSLHWIKCIFSRFEIVVRVEKLNARKWDNGYNQDAIYLPVVKDKLNLPLCPGWQRGINYTGIEYEYSGRICDLMKQSLPRNGGPSPKKVLKADVWVCDTEWGLQPNGVATGWLSFPLELPVSHTGKLLHLTPAQDSLPYQECSMSRLQKMVSWVWVQD